MKKITYNSPVILTFVLISFCAFLLDYFTKGLTNHLLFSVYKSSPFHPLFYVRLVGHAFGHASWGHFSGNIIMILLLGPLLEEKYGSLRIGIIIFITAILTGLVHILLFPSGLLGASGIVFAFILLSSLTSVQDGSIPLTFILVAVIYIGGQIFEGIFVTNNVSNLTHIIGAILGCIFGYTINKPKGR